ncbi:MAG TPA: MarR family transcriptional regulator [bacterium]|nr:MarR family transcriptional regulator [bacterium]
MPDESIEKIVHKIKDIFEKVEIYQGDYAGLDTKENGIIRAIARMDKPRVSDIARELNISMSTASWCIDRLEKMKYLERTRSEHDRRAVFVTLTKKGKKVIRQFEEIFERIGRAAYEQLSGEDLKSFADTLERLEISKD